MNYFGRAVSLLVIIVVVLYLLSRIFRGRPKRTLENWSGDGVFTDLEPGEAGVLICALPGAICAATLLWLESRRLLQVTSEVPLTLEWIGPPPATPLQRAVHGATTEEDYAEVLQVLYRQANHRLAPYSAPATARHYRKFVDDLWGDDLERNVDREGLEAWMVLRDAGHDWERLGDDEASERVKRAQRISGRLETLLFSDAFLAKIWSEGAPGFFRYRDDQQTSLHKVEPDMANSILLTSWLGFDETGSDFRDVDSDT